MAAATVLVAVVMVGVGASDNDEGSTPDDTAFVTTTANVQIATGETYRPVPKLPLSQSYARGAVGPEVKMIQDRLIELGFDPGVADGAFGGRTMQAVWAFEKLIMGTKFDEVTGRVTKEMWSRMQDPLLILPRRPNSTPSHTEVYLPQQVLIVFHDNEPILITHISSGDGVQWCEEVTISPGEIGNENGKTRIKKGICGVSVTPGGVFEYYRLVLGRRESQLGGMDNPVYFNQGIAVHGALDVPKRPASHGCIRIPMHISEYFQTIVTKGDKVFVFDGVKEPENYGAQLPVFNWRDPNYGTSTTTSSPATTKAPSTPPPAPSPTPAPAPPSVETTTTTIPPV